MLKQFAYTSKLVAVVCCIGAMLAPRAVLAFMFSSSDYVFRAFGNPTSIISGDFNGDSTNDLVVSNDALNLSIMYNNGDGTFRPTETVFTGDTNYTSLAGGDFNEDGKLDVASTSSAAQRDYLSVYFNSNLDPTKTQRGDEYYPDPALPGWDADPSMVIASEVNGDAKLDLVMVSTKLSKVSALINKGNGQFNSAVNYFTGIPMPLAVTSGDFNGDGTVDLVVVGISNDLAFLPGANGGVFGAAVAAPTGAVALGAHSVISGFVDADPARDLVVTNYEENSVFIMRGIGNGTFWPSIVVPVGAGPTAAVLEDFDKDGKFDLAVANRSDNSVSILKGDGKGGFSSIGDVSVGSGPVSLVAADLNGDQVFDLAVANRDSNEVSTLIGKGDGTFYPAASHWMPGDSSYPISFGTAADFNGDGRTDILLSSYVAAVGSLLINNGQGGFDLFRNYPSAHARRGVSGDFDQDGDFDLAAMADAWVGLDYAAILMGDGHGVFAAPLNYSVVVGNDIDCSSAAAGDFNSDGYPDLVTCDSVNGNVLIFTNNKDGTFAQTKVLAASATLVSEVLTDDFNRDGALDVAIGVEDDDSINVFKGDGLGSFSPPERYALRGEYAGYGLASGDFSGDGYPELAVIDITSDSVDVLINDGKGKFAAPLPSGAGNSWYNSFSVADFNGDGNLDLASYDGDVNALLFAGDGQGHFGAAVKYLAVKYPIGGEMADVETTSTFVGDFNGDGRTDLAVLEAKTSPHVMSALTVMIQQAPVIAFSAANYTVNESGAEALVTVKQAGNADGRALSVGYVVSDKTAKDGLNYVAASGTISWAAGDTADKTFKVAIKDTGHENPNMTVDLKLQNAIAADIDPQSAVAELVIIGNGSLCGNNIKESNEECDDGNVVTEAACPNAGPTCTICDATCKESSIDITSSAPPPPPGDGAPPPGDDAPPTLSTEGGGGGGCSLMPRR